MRPQIHMQAYGGQIRAVTPWHIFYLSPLEIKEDRCVRGGQPVLFPQFADFGPRKKHGFARDLIWRICEDTQIDALHRVVYSAEISEWVFPEWPFGAELTLSVELRPGIISQKLEIKNTGEEAFSWTGGLHPYFFISNFPSANLEGLEGVQYFDRYAPSEKHVQDAPLVWNEAACEKLFDCSPPLNLWSGSNHLRLQTKGFDQWMVWNPGMEEAKKIPDLPNGDWNKFVCIEPVCVDRPVRLEPGEVFQGAFEIGFDSECFKFDEFSKMD